jgi:hypothetical protein
MKIAIQGHPDKGHKVIQILESLGGKKLYYSNANDKCLAFFIDGKGCISCLHYENPTLKKYYKIYTLEEFEKEFPFKVGDIVQTVSNGQPGIITELCPDPVFVIAYKIRYNSKRELSFPAQILKLYQSMKNERNVTLTLDKAREWYNKGGELKEIALQAFTKEELNPLPKSWEEYCKGYQVPVMIFGPGISNKYVALWKLEQLRDCYRQGWKPTPVDYKRGIYSIKTVFMERSVYFYTSKEFLSFQSKEVAEEFLKNFEPLIKEAEDLLS